VTDDQQQSGNSPELQNTHCYRKATGLGLFRTPEWAMKLNVATQTSIERRGNDEEKGSLLKERGMVRGQSSISPFLSTLSAWPSVTLSMANDQWNFCFERTVPDCANIHRFEGLKSCRGRLAAMELILRRTLSPAERGNQGFAMPANRGKL
jgi:hypothetical protein